MTFFLRLFQLIFGCHHRHLSRVFTIRQRTYQVCFDCGRQIKYSWALMHSLPSEAVDNDDARLGHARHADVSVS